MTQSIESMKETIAAQAAVIEKLRTKLSRIPECEWWEDARSIVEEALTIPTDSTQILAEVRKQERERVAQMFEESGIGGDHLAAAIRAME